MQPDAERNADRNEEQESKEREEKQMDIMGDRSSDRFPHPDRLPKSGGRYQYPEPFEAFWRTYPDRRGSNSKLAAYRKWRSTVLDGVRPSRLFESAMKYREHVEEEGNLGTKFVMQAKTFLGPDEHWRQAWDSQPDPESEANQRAMKNYRSTLEAIRGTM